MVEIVTMAASLGSFMLLLAVCLILVYERGVSRAYERREKAAEESAKRAAEDEERKSRAMDEGFEAIMQYSVKGRDGFGGGK